jgi:hypothetical protein
MVDKQGGRDSLSIVLLMIAVMVALMVAVGLRLIDMHFVVGPWFLHHWLPWFGAAFIGVYTPVFYILKRQRKDIRDALIAVHVIGGLFAVALISLHFTHHVTRPAEFYPDLGTGIVMFSALTLSVLTGVLMRYRLLAGGMREWRLLHGGSAVTFYLTVGVHIAEGLGLV